MISGVEVKGFRGIREGRLEGLTQLVILVGPNGGGKSTVLDALLIGSVGDVAEGLIRVIQRHHGTREGTAWLLYRRGVIGPGLIQLSSPGLTRHVSFFPSRNESLNLQYEVGFSIADRSESIGGGEIKVAGNGELQSAGPLAGMDRPVPEDSEIRLIEPFATKQRVELYTLCTEAETTGRLEGALEILRSVVPGLVDLRVLTEGDRPVLHFKFSNYSVPVALGGDGVHALTRLCLELAVGPRGTVLLEEPEIHQHPRAIRQTAKAIVAAVRRDIQVVLTTHSLELIDALLDVSSPEELNERVALYRMLLSDGQLKSHRLTGEDARFSRSQIEDDLR